MSLSLRIAGAARQPLLAVAALALSACAATGPSPDRTAAAGAGDRVGARIADLALSLRGSPYRYGGSGPDAFDCSGLVHYTHLRAGVEVPRTAEAQYEAVDRLYLRQLRPGDVVFFRIDGIGVEHVGIYVGDQQFVHAPKSGTPVHTSSLEQRYWRQRVVRAGRLVD